MAAPIQVLWWLTRKMWCRDLRARGDVSAAIVLEIGSLVLGVASPFVLKVLIDSLSTGEGSWIRLTCLAMMFVMSLAGASVLSAQRMVFTARVIDLLYQAIVTATLTSQLSGFLALKRSDSGKIQGQLERLPMSLQVVCEGILWRTIPLGVQIIVALSLMAALIPSKFSLSMALMLAAFGAVSWYGAARQRGHAEAANTASGDVSRTLGDILRNARRVSFNGAIKSEIRETGRQLDLKRRTTEDLCSSLVRLSVLQYAVMGIGLLFLLVSSGLDVRSGVMTVGDFMLVQTYAARLTGPLTSFGFSLSQAAVSIQNISDIKSMELPVENSGNAEPPSDPARIVLEEVTFLYGDRRAGVSSVSTILQAGALIAIVGANGSGKSTLAQVIAGILSPSHGKVSINGQDLSAVPRGLHYRFVLYVPQYIGLFNRSLGANALYPPTKHTAASLADVLGDWQFYDDQRPIDLNLLVGEQGEQLSGGQIQKLELARLTGVCVPAMILDESTSALDPKSESNVIGALMACFDGRTTLIVITHKAALAKIADQVLYMKAGLLEAVDTHENLLERRGDYADLWVSPATSAK